MSDAAKPAMISAADADVLTNQGKPIGDLGQGRGGDSPRAGYVDRWGPVVITVGERMGKDFLGS
jgi:hypothetical protein